MRTSASDPAQKKRRAGRTGPVTAAGRRVSSRNALKHGLGVALGFTGPVMALAALLVDEGEGKEEALRLAEAFLDVRRVREARHQAMLAAVATQAEFVPASVFDRYERKALSRRRRLLRALEG
jgi:hypothetical protein